MKARGKKASQDYLEAEAAALGEHLEKLVSAIRDAARDKAERAEQVGEAVGEGVSESAEMAIDAIARIADAAHDLAARATGLAEDILGKAQRVKEGAAQSRRQLEDAVRERPLTSLALAALAGFMLAALMPSRRRRDSEENYDEGRP